VGRLEIDIKPLVRDDMVIAVDSTGVKVTNRGEWLREKWKIHRGWIKVHIAVDTETNRLVGLEVTDESGTARSSNPWWSRLVGAEER
jgi:hypothetical protein